MIGTVKWFNTKKGYGFIDGEDTKEYFVHFSRIISDKRYKALKNGSKVAFDTEANEDGRVYAVNVIPAKSVASTDEA